MISAGERVSSLKGQAWISLALLLVGVMSAWTLGGWITEGATQTLIVAALALCFGVIAVAILKNWRSGFFFFFVWLLFEDLARKFLGNNMLIYFGKDLLVGVTYFSFLGALRRRQALTFHPAFLFSLSLFFFLGVLQVFNPDSPSLIYGVLGFKLYFFYMPLIFVGYALIRSERELQKLLSLNMVLAGLIALVGIIQAIYGPEFLNPKVLAPEIEALAKLYRKSPTSGVMFLRPSSVFVSAGRFGAYLLLTWLLGIGAAAYLLPQARRHRKYILLGTALVAAAIVLGGSRGVLLYAAASAVVLATAFVWGAPAQEREGRQLVRAIRRMFLVFGLALVCLLLLFPREIASRWSFYAETLAIDSPRSELVERSWNYPVEEFLKAFTSPQWLLGNGIGTASLGVQYVSRLFGKTPPAIGVESGYGVLILELGILGPILWLVWSLILLGSSWKVVRRLRRTRLFPVGMSIWWFAFLLLVPITYGGMQSYQNYVLNAYLWLLIGVLFRLPELIGQGAHSEPARLSAPADGT